MPEIEPEQAPADERLPLTIEYSGCSMKSTPEGLVCALSPGQVLKVWAKSLPGSELSLSTSPGAVQVAGEPVAGGRLFQIDSSDARLIRVQARQGGSAARYQLVIERKEPSRVIREAMALGRAGRLEAAVSILEASLTQPIEEASADAGRGAVLGLLAQLERRAGRPERARKLLLEAVAEHRRWGEISKEVADRCLLVHIAYSDLGDFRSALSELENIPPIPAGDADAAYYRAYYQGTLALYTADFRSALRLLSSAREQRERLADARGQRIIVQMEARLLQRLGRFEEARRLLESLISDPEYLDRLSTCERVELFNNVGWDRLLKVEAGAPAEDPLPLFERARKEMNADPHCKATDRASLQINLGLAYLHRGALGEAQRLLEGSRPTLGNASPRLLLWHLDLESRLDEEHGRFDRGAEGFRKLHQLAEAAISLEAQWRALFGLARVREAAGRPEEALEAFSKAEEVLDTISLRSPVGVGRATSIVAGEGSTRAYLSLLLELGREGKASEVARRSRSRILRGLLFEERLARLSLEERAEWSRLMARYETLAQELESAVAEAWQATGNQRRRLDEHRRQQRLELDRQLDLAIALLDAKGLAEEAGPWVAGPEEVILLYHPTARGWAGFAASESGSIAAELGPLSEDEPLAELSPRLLKPFQGLLEEAEKLRVLSTGWLRELDFHALKLDGRLLVSRVSVSYGLDLPRDSSLPEARTETRALVVADPTETLPAAGREAGLVADRLERQGASVIRLSGAAASRGSVLEGLQGADLFHFAGHGDLGNGLDGALRLASGGRLSVGDVLAATAVPASVVLAACDSGRPAPGATIPALGLAQAFLIAGSREALAVSRPVEDQEAAALVAAVYRQWEGEVTLAEALRRAQLEPGIQAGMDWAAFRVLVR